MVSVHLENSTCTAPHLSKIFPMLPLKQWKQFQYLVDDGCLMSFHGRLCSALSFHASLLQKLMLCSVTSSLWDMSYRDGFLSFFPAVDMCRERKLGNLCCVTSLFWGITRRDSFLSFFCMLLMCSVTSSFWGVAHEDGFLSFFPCCRPAVHQLGSQGLGVRAGLPTGQQHLAQRLPRRDAQAVGYRQLHAAGRDQGPLFPHQCHRHQLLTGLHSLQVSCWVGVGNASCVLSVTRREWVKQHLG